MRRRRAFNIAQAESDSVRRAKQKNATARAHLEENLMSLENERANIITKYQRKADELDRRLEDIGYTQSMPLLLLNVIHLQRRMTSHDVSMNIANCYLMHQEKNMEKLKAAIEGSDRAAPRNLEKQVLRHAKFIRNAFEEAYNITTDINWNYGYDRSADIYEYGRTGHDLRCPSVKDAPVGVKTGAYPEFKQVNVAAYDARKVEGTIGGQRASENVVRQSVPQPKESLLPPLPLDKQTPEIQPIKARLRARPPSAGRHRLTLRMRKRHVGKK